MFSFKIKINNNSYIKEQAAEQMILSHGKN